MSNSIAFITGIGLVTPLGDTPQKTWDALLAGRAIASHARCAADNQASALPRVSQLAIRAARQALISVGSSSNPSDTAVVLGTSKGPIESWLPNIRGTCSADPPSILSDPPSNSFGLASVASDVALALNLHGPRLTLSAACASGLHALIRGAMLISSGQCARVLVVAAEASVHPLFLASFRRLGVLADESAGCRPFDARRRGFFMSEAAVALLLEARPTAAAAAASIAVERFALGADATHLTGIDPLGRALRHVLAQTLDHSPVDLVHAHGTATIANDPVELSALDDLTAPADRPPNLYSHKAALGHSLGAAGLISVALNVMSHRTATVLPNVRTSDPLPSRHILIAPQTVERPIRRSLAVAAGFGGALAAVTLVSPVPQ